MLAIGSKTFVCVFHKEGLKNALSVSDDHVLNLLHRRREQTKIIIMLFVPFWSNALKE